MKELEHREKSVLVAFIVQVLVVGLVVFLLTQAYRTLSYQREVCADAEERLVSCQTQLDENRSDLSQVRARIADAQSQVISVEEVELLAQKIQQVAESTFVFEDVRVRVGSTPEWTRSIPLPDAEPFLIELYPLEFWAAGRTGEAAGFLRHLEDLALIQVAYLDKLNIESVESEAFVVKIHIKWLVAVSKSLAEGSNPNLSRERLPEPAFIQKWGREPFLSPNSRKE